MPAVLQNAVINNAIAIVTVNTEEPAAVVIVGHHQLRAAGGTSATQSGGPRHFGPGAAKERTGRGRFPSAGSTTGRAQQQ